MSDWPSGLFGCCSDIGICCRGMSCIKCLQADNWARVNDRDCSCWDFFCGVSEFLTRSILRTKLRMEQAHCSDCLVLSCCYPLALCQDARNIKKLHQVDNGSG